MSEFLRDFRTELIHNWKNLTNKIEKLFRGSSEKEKYQEYKSPVEVAKIVLELFDQLPMAYKRFATFTDVIIVIVGIKAATDLSFLAHTWNEKDFSMLEEAFQSVGLKCSPVQLLRKGPKPPPFRHTFIYNPSALVATTRNSSLVPPYNLTMEINEYLAEGERLGHHIAALMGKIYSFPESAIRDYLSFMESGDEKESNRRRETSSLKVNETYWWFYPAQQDVLDRESLKREYMQEFMNIPDIINLYNSNKLAKSNQEWSSRLPNRIKK